MLGEEAVDQLLAGSFDGDFLWADRIHIGERDDGSIEIDGSVAALTAEGFVIELRRGGQRRRGRRRALPRPR